MTLSDKNNKIELRDVLFWDVDIAKIDLINSEKLIIERVFSRGNQLEISNIISYYGLYIIKDIVKSSGYYDRKTLNFLSQLLDLPKSEFKCYEKRQQSKVHWN